MTTNHSGMSYKEMLEAALEDEQRAGPMYRYIASMSPSAGGAEQLRKIAADEDRHRLVIGQLLAEITGEGETRGEYTQRMEVALGHVHPSQAGKRPFPSTYGDWVDLAEDIKARYPDDPVMRATANFSLQQILEWEQYTRPPDEQEVAEKSANEAKRWLINKAGELGIH